MTFGPQELPKPLPPKPTPIPVPDDVPIGDPRSERPSINDPLPGERVPPLNEDRDRPNRYLKHAERNFCSERAHGNA